MTWEQLDWAALDRLRESFLADRPPTVPYWRSREELASYDFTYGARIGWKWDAVLRELDRRAWRPGSPATSKLEHGWGRAAEPPGLPVLDWGCGSGVAGRRVVRWLGQERVTALRVWDLSALAADFAADAARRDFPGLRVEQITPGFLAGRESVGLLVISHVLNELPAEEMHALRELVGRAEAMLWVEPGTREVSRALVEIREQLRDRFHLIAPCTHQAVCGLRTPENERHWCHHFAAPPAGIFADSNWTRFGQRAGIDLRSLPYSFLAMEAATHPPAATDGWARVIGAPRVYKGFAKILSCDGKGVEELTLQKRDAPELFRQLKRGEHEPIYRWRREAGRIVGCEPAPTFDSASGPSAIAGQSRVHADG